MSILEMLLLHQVPGGWAAQRWGGRITLSASFALWSTASGLTPGDARRTTAVAAARVCVGIAQGFLIPAVHTVLAQVCGTRLAHVHMRLHLHLSVSSAVDCSVVSRQSASRVICIKVLYGASSRHYEAEGKPDIHS